MENSKVFFTDLRTVPGNDMLTKLERLIRRAGIADIDFDGKFTAIAAASAGCFVPTYWIILDQWVLPFLHRFQPYPFKLLGLVTPGT